MRNNRFQRALFFTLMVWVFVSSLYYAPNLIQGELLTGRSENISHKVAKYAASAFFVVFFVLTHGDKKILIQGILLCIIASGMFIFSLNDYNVNFGIDVAAIFIAFYGLSYVSSRFNISQINTLGIVLVFSATLVSIVSYF